MIMYVVGYIDDKIQDYSGYLEMSINNCTVENV